MSIIYVASIGTTAATKKYYWTDAKKRFHYTESVLICGNNLVEDVSRFLDKNANLIIIESPFNGTEGYVEAVENIARQVIDIIKAYTAKDKMIDEVVVNTAGGTEKMSCIIKDAIDVIKQFFPYVTHVWGGTCGYETVYTTKPNIYIEDIKEKLFPEKAANKSIERPSITNFENIQTNTNTVTNTPKRKHKKKKKKQKKPIDPNILKQQKEAQQRRNKRKEEKKQKREAIRLQKHKERMKITKLSQKYKIDDSLQSIKPLWDDFEEWIDKFNPE